MKLTFLSLLYWSYIQLSASFPVEDKPGFTPWPLQKRGIISPVVFSNALGGPEATFGVDDDTCDGKLPSPGCWNMMDVTVDKMIENRAEKTKTNCAPCLFYTQYLSGAAEREANFILREVLLWGAVEEGRRYQTIWDLHDKKFYPEDGKLAQTPEVSCMYNDFKDDDWSTKRESCRRAYFKSMSKAMAMECTGTVYVMTMTDLKANQPVPDDGIWWQVEFPTLISEDRTANKKIDKIVYLQVPLKTKEEMEELRKVSKDERKPPKIEKEAEYWPNGPGADQLAGNMQQKRSLTSNEKQEEPQQEYSSTTSGIVKRASADDGREKVGVLDPDDEEYPYAYDIDQIYDWYKDATW